MSKSAKTVAAVSGLTAGVKLTIVTTTFVVLAGGWQLTRDETKLTPPAIEAPASQDHAAAHKLSPVPQTHKLVLPSKLAPKPTAFPNKVTLLTDSMNTSIY